MSAPIRDENFINNASFTATITSGVILNDGRTTWILVIRTGAITTTPTLTPTLQGSTDGVNFYQIDAPGAISTANAVQRTVYGPASAKGQLAEPFLKVILTFGGAGNFANTFADLLGV